METPEIHDITAPGEFLPEPTTPWWVWSIAAAAVLLIIALIITWLRKPNPAKRRATLLDEARARLAKIREEADGTTPQSIATKTSLVIRRYLEDAFNDPALFETNEELTLRPQALEKLHPDSREPTKNYLTSLSQLKYAPSQEIEAMKLIDEAEELLANIEINVSPTEV